MMVQPLICSAPGAVDLAVFKELLLRTCGSSFEKEREQALSKGLCKRMSTLGIDKHETYHSLLLRDPDELLRLTELLTVNETYFFREPEHLNLMVEKLLPELMAGYRQRPVRIVSAGCSTGEEPYSVAIMLRERFGAESERLFTITGVDIDSNVIAAAKNGVYGRNSFRGMSRVIQEHYFEPVAPGGYRVRDDVRKMVGFEVVNLLGPSYPHRMQLPDIILYRNVSIYFPGQVQRDIFARLAELLVDGGCLLVGASETIHHDVGILSLVKEESLFFYRKTPPLNFEERRLSSRYSSNPERSPVAALPIHPARPEALQNRRQQGHVHELRGNPPLNAPRVPDVRDRFDEAVLLAHNRHHDKALAVLDAIIGQDSAFEKAYSLKGSLLLSASRFDEAKIVCEAILGRDPLCLVAYLMLGMIARQKGDDEGALRRFREAIYLDAACWLAHFYSAEILFAQRETKRARSSYETVVRILEKGPLKELGQAFFPLTFNADQFIIICRHKLLLLTPKADPLVNPKKGIKYGI